MSNARPILPGATLGVLGGGQLGRMFTMAATRMGYRVLVFSPQRNSPAGQLAHKEIWADYDDDRAIRRFAERCDAVTLEFENVPVRAVEIAAAHSATRPGDEVLAIAQDRLKERLFLDRFGLPSAPHAAVRAAEDVTAAVERLGTPVVLKCARLGYDGRGQVRIDRPDDAEAAWRRLDVDAALCEAWVDYECELSVIVARSAGGDVQTFGPIENDHVNHILDCSVAPAGVPSRIAREAIELARDVANALDLEGLICVEMFLLTDGALLINEMAPRPHNSGHLTIEACHVSQFEQQVRATCNLPLAPMTLRSPAAMVNLLGDLWRGGEPCWDRAPVKPPVNLHLYGKDRPRPGRKMGHLTAVAESSATARQRALEARDAIRRDAQHAVSQRPQTARL
jgi:5-(carboxyamino)imidazole ribonucleotide synthase